MAIELFRSARWRPNYAVEDELHAYIDGAAGPAERARIESYLSLFPEERDRIEAYRRQNILLHRLYDRPALPATPQSYRAQAERLARALRRGRRAWAAARLAAAASVAGLAAFGGWTGLERLYQPESPLAAFTRQATEAHMMLAGDGFPGGLAAARAPSGPAAFGWLSDRRGGLPSEPPKLDGHGFAMLGGRILPTGHGAAVQLLYGDKENRRVTLFMGPSRNGHQTASTVIDDGDVALMYWQLGGLAYSLIGNVDRKTLLALAGTVSESLKSRPSPPVRRGGAGADKPAPDPGRKIEFAPLPGALPGAPGAPGPADPRKAAPEGKPGVTEAGMKPQT